MRKMRERRIIFAALALCCLCMYFGVDMTGAWFVTGGTFGTMSAENAKVEYLPTMTNDTPAIHGKLIDGTTTTGEGEGAVTNTVYIIPGSELVESATGYPGKLMLQNLSTTATETRLVLECTLTDSAATPITGLIWQRIGTSESYYIGKNDVSGRFMPLLEVDFMANTTTGSEYRWNYQYISDYTPVDGMVNFSTYWELMVGATPTTIVPATDGAVADDYDIIDSVKVADVYTHDDANDALDVTQDEFDDYFSTAFAGNTMEIKITYHARQSAYMLWTQFAQQYLSVIT